MNKQRLQNILNTTSVSGHEDSLANILSMDFMKYGTKEFEDKVGNICYSIGSGTPKYTMMLSAHIDEIGLRVQYIDDKGFVYFIPNGGVDRKVLLGATVLAYGCKTTNLYGVIGKKPIHVEWHSKDEKNEVTDIKDMKVDFGFETKEEALKELQIGDVMCVYAPFRELGANRFTCKGLDDKVGAFILAEVMERLSRVELKNFKVYFVGCTQEETSASGAIASAMKINPNFSIDYDVTFATDDDYVSPKEWGDIQLGKGGALAHSVDGNYRFVNYIKNNLRQANIPFQEFSLGSGGTDTVYIKQSSTDVQTALISIPNRNMHTQAEVCDYRDLESIINMTCETILHMDQDVSISQL